MLQMYADDEGQDDLGLKGGVVLTEGSDAGGGGGPGWHGDHKEAEGAEKVGRGEEGGLKGEGGREGGLKGKGGAYKMKRCWRWWWPRRAW